MIFSHINIWTASVAQQQMLNQQVYSLAADTLSFASGYQLTVNHDHWSRVQKQLFEKFVTTYQYFSKIILKTVLSKK